MGDLQLLYRLQLLFIKILRYIYKKFSISSNLKDQVVNQLIRFKWFRHHYMQINNFQHRMPPMRKVSVYRQHIKNILEESKNIDNKPGYTAKSATSLDADKLALRAIAFYLPQIHPILEDERHWGAGFTVWTNVTKAVPQFLGHYQPHLPDELGFYDLRLPEVLQQQVALAKQYGLYGFCFYHYWFNGKRLLERPVNQFLADTTLDINFCLCWANENWTRRGEGQESEVLVAQYYSAESDLSFIEDLATIFYDKRYIRVNNRPLLVIYRASLLPTPVKTIQCWRARIKELGFEDLYLVAVLSYDMLEEEQMAVGFDAVMEFPPHKFSATNIVDQCHIINESYSGSIYSYENLVESYNPIQLTNVKKLRGIMPSWDNEARHPGAGHTFFGATPKLYKRWLKKVCQATFLNSPQERIFFINAWNEWAEGAHLEPDRKFGYGYLQVTANVLSDYYQDPVVAEFIQKTNQQFRKRSHIAVVLHCYYEDLIDSIFRDYLADNHSILDLFVTVNTHITLNGLQKMREFFTNIYIVMHRNYGRDICPFLNILKTVDNVGYEFICKVHTKKSPQRRDGEKLRQGMFNSLLGGADKVKQVVQAFNADPSLGILAPRNQILKLSHKKLYMPNMKWLDKLLVRMGLHKLIGNYAGSFPAGSMYWFRMAALRDLDSLVLHEASFEFEEEYGQEDGTLAHAVERIIALFAEQRGYHMQPIDS